jgi:uncharacterized coiled-coil DUF342 family protein
MSEKDYDGPARDDETPGVVDELRAQVRSLEEERDRAVARVQELEAALATLHGEATKGASG